MAVYWIEGEDTLPYINFVDEDDADTEHDVAATSTISIEYTYIPAELAISGTAISEIAAVAMWKVLKTIFLLNSKTIQAHMAEDNINKSRKLAQKLKRRSHDISIKTYEYPGGADTDFDA